MAYGDTASAYGRGEANGGGWGPSRGLAVGRETKGPQIGNWVGAPVYRASSGLGPFRGDLTNFQATNLNAIDRGTQSEFRPGAYAAGLGTGGMGGTNGQGLASLPRQMPVAAPPYVPPPPWVPPPKRPAYFGPPAIAPETPAPYAPVTPNWSYSYGEDYTNPPTYSPGVNPYKTDFGGGNPDPATNPFSRGWR